MMLKLTELAAASRAPDDKLTLPFDLRQKSRLRAVTEQGKEVGIFLPRGTTLCSGMVLTGADGLCVKIEAAAESVSMMRCDDLLQFSRACYHLGNRHVPLQILPGELRYLCDHVLDRMVEGLGMEVEHRDLPFEPEAGAYHRHDH